MAAVSSLISSVTERKTEAETVPSAEATLTSEASPASVPPLPGDGVARSLPPTVGRSDSVSPAPSATAPTTASFTPVFAEMSSTSSASSSSTMSSQLPTYLIMQKRSSPLMAAPTAFASVTAPPALPPSPQPYLTQYLEIDELQALLEKNSTHWTTLHQAAIATAFNPYARVNYALCLRTGTGVSRDLMTAQSILSDTANSPHNVPAGSKNRYALYELAFLLQDHFPDQKSRAQECQKQAIALNCPRALTTLGRSYLSNKKTLKKAETQFKKALKEDKNYATAMLELALLYFNSEFPAKPAEALKFLEQAAENGNIKAQSYLQEMYLNGKEIPVGSIVMTIGKDIGKAIHYWQLLAEQDRKALYELGKCYLTGDHRVPIDFRRGLSLIKKSATLGHSEATQYLALEVKKREEKLAAEKSMLLLLGDALGKSPIVQRYAPSSAAIAFSEPFPVLPLVRSPEDPLREHLLIGAPFYGGLKDLSKDAFEALKREAESPTSTNTFAKCNYGTCLREGIHIDKDTVRAMQLFNESAAQGDPMGLAKIGICFHYGKGVPKDISKAVTYFTQAAIAGCSTAMHHLGLLYINGEKVEKNTDLGFKHLRRSVELNYSEAMVSLGWQYEQGKEIARDLKQAMELYSQAAALGNTEAMRNLGALYLDGAEGLEKNVEKGLMCYRKAIEFKDPNAMLALGYRYENGNGVTRDLKLGMELYEQAAALENTSAMRNLALLYIEGREDLKKEVEKGILYFRRAIELKDSDAMLDLGWRYVNGQEITRDLKQGMALYEQAAALENTIAMRNLAHLYLNGAEGLEKNADKGLAYFRKAVDLKDSQAMVNLAWRYRYGKDVIRDLNRAIVLYEQAATLDNATAMRILGILYLEGDVGLEKNVEKGLVYLRKAVELKDSHAMVNLGWRYGRNNQGVKEDRALAVKLYQQAVDLGNIQALTNLGYCYKNGFGVTANILTAMDYFNKAIQRGKSGDDGFDDAHYELGMIYYRGGSSYVGYQPFTPSKTENKEHLKLALNHISIAAKEGHADAKKEMENIQKAYEETLKQFNAIDEALLLFQRPLSPPGTALVSTIVPASTAVPVAPVSSVTPISPPASTLIPPPPASSVSPASIAVPAQPAAPPVVFSSFMTPIRLPVPELVSYPASVSSALPTFGSESQSSGSSSTLAVSTEQEGSGSGGVSSPLKRKDYPNGTGTIASSSDDKDEIASPRTKKHKG